MTFKNVLLVNQRVPDFQVFLDSVNDSTCAIAYSSSTTKVELMELIQQKTTSAERIAVVSRKEDLFVESMQITDCEEFFRQLIQSFGVKNLDFLACNTLMDPRWKEFFARLDSVVVGASNDLTGNLKYGGNWMMENTKEDIEVIYFKNTIQYYNYLLDFNNTFELIVKEDGFLYGRGRRDQGQLGSTGTYIPTFTQITMNGNPISGVTQIACGSNHTVFVKDGFLYGMGEEYYGQLGITGITTTPRQITMDGTLNGVPVSGVTQIACGNRYTVFVKDGILYGMGYNNYSQLGITGDTTTPRQITLDGTANGVPISGVSQIACGRDHTVFVKSGILYGMGRNNYGQLGITGITTTPRQITMDGTLNGVPVSGVSQIAGGDTHTVFVKDGILYGMGRNNYGQLGIIAGPTTTPRQITMDETPVRGVSQIACGDTHVVFVKDGILYGMGDNYYGQLGFKDTVNIPTPTKIPLNGVSSSNEFISDVTQIACGLIHTSIIKLNVLYGTVNDLYGFGSFYNNTTEEGTKIYYHQLAGPIFIENGVSFIKGFPDFIINASFKSTICFPSGTIKTDQGFVKTSDLNQTLHTINGQTITTITNKCNSLGVIENILVFLKKDSYIY